MFFSGEKKKKKRHLTLIKLTQRNTLNKEMTMGKMKFFRLDSIGCFTIFSRFNEIKTQPNAHAESRAKANEQADYFSCTLIGHRRTLKFTSTAMNARSRRFAASET